MSPSHDPARPSAGVLVRPLTTAEESLVPGLWNGAWAPHVDHMSAPYPLDDAVWRDRLAAHHDPDLLIGAFEDERLIGVAYGRTPTASWLPQDVGWISLVAVTPDRQGTGVGTVLARALADLLLDRGCHTLRFGSEANHLLPGIPQEAPAAAWRLARRLGARFGNVEHDLHLDLHAELPPAPLPDGWHVRDDDPEAAVTFVERVFPGRWAHEVRQYVGAGTTVLTLAPVGSDDAPASARAEGFCVVFQGNEGVRGPSLTWVPSGLLASRDGGSGSSSGSGSGTGSGSGSGTGIGIGIGSGVAGMGPLGVSEAARGRGLGLGLVRAAAVWLAARGATEVIVNWTTLTGFYGRLGARVHRSYQRAEAPLSTAKQAAMSTTKQATRPTAKHTTEQTARPTERSDEPREKAEAPR